MKRPRYLKQLIQYRNNGFIKVITGVRSSGKSYLLKMLYAYLVKKGYHDSVTLINFKHPEAYRFHTMGTLYAYIKQTITPHTKHTFLFDEIQLVDGWQALIIGLELAYDCDIYITSSNVHLLKHDLSDSFTGKYIEIKVYPLSYRELLIAKKAKTHQQKQTVLNDYLLYGGYPAVALLDNNESKKSVLKTLFNSILVKDVPSRAKDTNIDLLIKISLVLMNNIGKPVSTLRISKALELSGTKVKVETLERHLSYLIDSHIFNKVIVYGHKEKTRSRDLHKYYIVDVGFRNSVLGSHKTTLDSHIDNIVYLKLIKSGYEVYLGRNDVREPNFVCVRDGRIKYVQVSNSIPKESPKETKNYLFIQGSFVKLIITLNAEDVGIYGDSIVIHLSDFLENNY